MTLINVDPRLERIFNVLIRGWSRISEPQREAIWRFCQFLYNLRYRRKGHVSKINLSHVKKVPIEAILPTQTEWENLEWHRPEVWSIYVLIPVYKGYEQTLRCIYSVLSAKNNCAYNILIINDASPDEKLDLELRKIASRFKFEYIVNKENVGFVKTTNRGMEYWPDKDVVWLNSDTEVFDYWLDRIVSISDRNENIATITPLTSNGTICSYPNFLVDNPYSLDISDKEFDCICGRVCSGNLYETPTGVGFCMYVRRKALNEIGFLDEAKFGKGYGEENDLCQRFAKSGYQNVITTSVFVRHYGSVSFGNESKQLQKRAIALINKLYPNYSKDVSMHIALNLTKEDYFKLDLARLREKFKNLKIYIFISHKRLGGTEFFIQNIERKLSEKQVKVLKIRPSESGLISLEGESCELYPNLFNIDIKHYPQFLEHIVNILDVKYIHLHSLVDFTEDFAYLLSETLEKTHTKLVVSLHDYHFLCPSINMVDLDGHVCKSVHRTKCEHCCRLKGVFPFWKNLKISKDILSKAIKVIAPSEITCKIYSSVFSSIPLTVIPHDESYLNIVNEIGYSCEDDRTFRIGFLGAVNDLKGVRIIKELAERSGREKSDIELVVIGYTNIDDELANLGVKILGQYGSDEEAIKTICKNRLDIIFLPFQWNETYSYVTSLALASGVPVAVTRLGAAAERLEALGLGDHIIDSETLNDSDLLVAKLKKISKLPKIRYQPNHTDIEQYYDDI